MRLNARGNDDDFDDNFPDEGDMPEFDDAEFDYEDIDFDGWETFEEDEY